MTYLASGWWFSGVPTELYKVKFGCVCTYIFAVNRSYVYAWFVYNRSLLLFWFSFFLLVSCNMCSSATWHIDNESELLGRIILDSFRVTCSQHFTRTCHFLFFSQLWRYLYMRFYCMEVMIIVHVSHALNSLSVPLTSQLLFCSLPWLFCISQIYNKLSSMHCFYASGILSMLCLILKKQLDIICVIYIIRRPVE